MKKIIYTTILSTFLLIACNEYSIIEGIEPEKKSKVTPLTQGSFVPLSEDYPYTIQHTLFVKSDFGTGPVDVEYQFEGLNISKKTTIIKYYPTAPINCQETTESTVVFNLTPFVNANSTIKNATFIINIKANAQNGKVFNKRIEAKINYCYWYFINEFEMI